MWVFPKIRDTPKWIMENPIKMDDLWVPLFSEISMYLLVVEPTHLKNMLVKLDHLPRDPG